MKKLLLTLLMVTLILTGCIEESPPEEYIKTTGEVTGSISESGRFGTNYYVQVSYQINSKKYGIDKVFIGNDKNQLDDYKPKDKVTVYFNENGVGSIVK